MDLLQPGSIITMGTGFQAITTQNGLVACQEADAIAVTGSAHLRVDGTPWANVDFFAAGGTRLPANR